MGQVIINVANVHGIQYLASSGEYVRILVDEVDRPMGSVDVQMEDHESKHGAMLMGEFYRCPEITLGVWIVGSTAQARLDAIREIFLLTQFEDPVKLQFSDDSGFYYMVRRTGAAQGKNHIDSTYAQLTYKDVPLILYGHSMGGNIGLDYRRRGGLNDVPAAYIITAPWIRLARPIPAALYYLMKGMAKIRPSMILSSAVDESKLGNPENVLPYNDNPMVHNKISALCAVEGFEIGRGLERGTLAESGRADHIPMLLMHGTDDQICDITGTQKLAQRITRRGQPVEYIEWEGLYHEIHNGGPDSTGDEVIDKMVDFIGTFC